MVAASTIGAAASKKCSLVSPTSADRAGSSASLVSGPVATMHRPGGGIARGLLAHDVDERVRLEHRGDERGEPLPVHRERGARRAPRWPARTR